MLAKLAQAGQIYDVRHKGALANSCEESIAVSRSRVG
jgi:hypothetical protein